MANQGKRGPRNETPVTPARNVPASQRSTRTAPHKLPVSGPDQGSMRMQRRTPTAQVTGPAAWENGRGPVETQSGNPPLAGATPADAHPCGTDCTQP